MNKFLLNAQKYDFLIIVFLITIVYIQTLDYNYVNFDDNLKILHNYEKLTDLSKITDAFFTDSYFNNGGYYYRPTLTLSFYLDAFIGGKNPFFYHLSNIILHILSCIFLLILLRKFTTDHGLALLITSIFAVNPLFLNAVAWIPGRNDIIASLFVILSLFYFLKYSEKINPLFAFLHLLFYLIACFSKEIAVLLPVLIILYIILIKKEKVVNKKYLKIYVFLFIIVAFYLIMRSNAVIALETNENIFKNFIYNLPIIPELIGKFILPVNISGLPVYSIYHTIVGVIAILLILLSVFLLKNYKNNRNIILFALSWVVLLIIPGMFTNMGTSTFDYLECRAYLPMIGFLFFLVIIIEKYYSHHKLIINIILICLIIAYSILNLMSADIYKNPINFYNNAVQNNQSSALVYNNRGVEFRKIGNIKEAVEDFRKALKLNPDLTDAYFNLAEILNRANHKKEALILYNKGLSLDKNVYNAYLMRGDLKKDMGDIQAAIDDYNYIIKNKSNHPRAYFSRAVALMIQKKYKLAIDDFNKAISINKNYTKAYINRGLSYAYLKKYNLAIEDYNKAEILDSTNSIIFYNRANAKFLMKDTLSACLDWYKALELGNKDAAKYISIYCYHNK
jgi:protein O-mannosyl-transferase